MSEDIYDTARLVLLDQQSANQRSPLAFATAMRAEHPGLDAVELMRIYKRFMGFDGRIAPTHDLLTGQRL